MVKMEKLNMGEQMKQKKYFYSAEYQKNLFRKSLQFYYNKSKLKNSDSFFYFT